MGCPSEVYLGDSLVFTVCTHTPGTSAVTDADAVPVYWIYEDETGVSINTNTPDSDEMAKLDDAHSTGLYSESVECSAANGFESGKTYTLYVQATVGGITGGKTYSFKVKKALGGIKKNVAFSDFEFLMIDSSDHLSPKTGLTVAATISKDGGAFAVATNSVSEISGGIYTIDLTADEMNADMLTIIFTASGADQRTITLVTE